MDSNGVNDVNDEMTGILSSINTIPVKYDILLKQLYLEKQEVLKNHIKDMIYKALIDDIVSGVFTSLDDVRIIALFMKGS